MTSVFSGKDGLVEAVRRQFPGSGDTILALAAVATCREDLPLREMASSFGSLEHGPVEPDLSDAGIAKALEDVSKGFILPGGRRLAMDFRGHVGETPYFSDYHTPYDTRLCLDLVLLVSEDGDVPIGMVPLPEGSDCLYDVCEAVPAEDTVIVTDNWEYDRRGVGTLDRWGTDWLLTMYPFQGSVSTANVKMSTLKHDGRDFETCKARFDKHFLFRFTDLAERERVLERIPYICRDRRDESFLRKAAGVTDAVSSQSFDIRAVRRMMDIRRDWNRIMRRNWNLLTADAPSTREEAMGLMGIQILSALLD